MPSLSCTGEEGWEEGEISKESRKGRPSLSSTGEEGCGGSQLGVQAGKAFLMSRTGEEG